MSEPQQEQDKPDGFLIKKKHLIIAGVAVTLLIVAAVVVGLNWNSWFGGDHPPVSQTGTPDIDPGAADWMQSNPPDKTGGSSTGIAIPGYPSINLPADTRDVQAALLNPAGTPATSLSRSC